MPVSSHLPGTPARAVAHRRGPRRGRRILAGIAIGLALILVGTGGYVAYSYQHLTSSITHVNAIQTPTKTVHGSTKAAASADENILLIGDDHRPANASARTLAERAPRPMAAV